MQLIPARGRLLSRHGKTERGNHVMQLSPARGRLRFSLAFNLLSIGMQLIPARGRLLAGKELFTVIKDAAYPREGTVTATPACRSPGYGCSLSPRGDGYRALHRFLPAVDGCSLAPRGDGYSNSGYTSAIFARCSLSPRGDFLHVLSPANFRHFIDNSHILCYTSW